MSLSLLVEAAGGGGGRNVGKPPASQRGPPGVTSWGSTGEEWHVRGNGIVRLSGGEANRKESHRGKSSSKGSGKGRVVTERHGGVGNNVVGDGSQKDMGKSSNATSSKDTNATTNQKEGGRGGGRDLQKIEKESDKEKEREKEEEEEEDVSVMSSWEVTQPAIDPLLLQSLDACPKVPPMQPSPEQNRWCRISYFPISTTCRFHIISNRQVENPPPRTDEDVGEVFYTSSGGSSELEGKGELDKVGALKSDLSVLSGWKNPSSKLRWLDVSFKFSPHPFEKRACNGSKDRYDAELPACTLVTEECFCICQQAQMREVLRRVAPPTDKIKRELAFVSMLKRLVKELLGSQAGISPYGSAAAGFGTIDSDLDLQLALGKGWEARVGLRPKP
jgi:hypothetical protein